jgi:hypothetical protein
LFQYTQENSGGCWRLAAVAGGIAERHLGGVSP